jgi:hypothetical protein
VQDVESLPALEVPDIDGSFQSRTPIEVCCESVELYSDYDYVYMHAPDDWRRSLGLVTG